MLYTTLIIFLVFYCVAVVESAENKISFKSKTVNRAFAPAGVQSQSSKMQKTNSKINAAAEEAQPSRQIFAFKRSRQNSIVSLVRMARDEAIDIFDSLAYAEDNQERFESLTEICNRHKGTLCAIGCALVIKKGLSPSDVNLGAKAVEDLRRKEAMKWGTRLIK